MVTGNDVVVCARVYDGFGPVYGGGGGHASVAQAWVLRWLFRAGHALPPCATCLVIL